MKMVNRICCFDVLKGILIILVIIGHAIQSNIDNYSVNPFFLLIYSFHMPLFFIISGYLTYKEKLEWKMINKRALNLLLPFVTWIILSPILRGDKPSLDYILHVMTHQDEGLWFLYNLFVYSALVCVVSKIASFFLYRQEILSISIFVIMCLSIKILNLFSNGSSLCNFFPFFAIGYLLKKNEILTKVSTKNIIALGCIYVVSFPFWRFNVPPTFTDGMNINVTILGACTKTYQYLVQVSGSLFLLFMGFRYLNRPLHLLNKFGGATLGIYASNFVSLQYAAFFCSFENISIMIIIQSALALIFSYLFVLTIRKVKYLRLFILGER